MGVPGVGEREACSRFGCISYVGLLKFNGHGSCYGLVLLLVGCYCVHVSPCDAAQLNV